MTDTYARQVARGPAIRGWDAASLAEFDRRWLRGDTIRELADAFGTTCAFVSLIRLRRGLPTRRDPDGRWRGGPRGVNGQSKRDGCFPPTAPS